MKSRIIIVMLMAASSAIAQTPSVKMTTTPDTTGYSWMELSGKWCRYAIHNTTFTLYQQTSSAPKYSTDIGITENEQYGIDAIPDVSGDGNEDIMILTSTQVCILDGENGGILYKWNPPDFSGIVFVADVDGDGRNEIVTYGDSVVQNGIYLDYTFFTIYSTSGVATGVTRQVRGQPSSFSLSQNYPNPFNPTTTIDYRLAARTHVVLTVYDVLGRQVRTLVDQEQDAGGHSVMIGDNGLATGVYFYRLQAGTFTAVKKFMLVK